MCTAEFHLSPSPVYLSFRLHDLIHHLCQAHDWATSFPAYSEVRDLFGSTLQSCDPQSSGPTIGCGSDPLIRDKYKFIYFFSSYKETLN